MWGYLVGCVFFAKFKLVDNGINIDRIKYDLSNKSKVPVATPHWKDCTVK